MDRLKWFVQLSEHHPLGGLLSCWYFTSSWCPGDSPFCFSRVNTGDSSIQEIVPFSAVALEDLNEVFQRGRPMRLHMPPGKAHLNLIHSSVTVIGQKPYCFQLLLPTYRLPHFSPSPGHRVLPTHDTSFPRQGERNSCIRQIWCEAAVTS